MTFEYAWRKIRNAIVSRDRKKCKFCGSTENLHVHHIRPRSMGGDNRPGNLITLCRDCHIQDHAQIRQDGLATIPGPEYEMDREYLTNKKDVARYMRKLKDRGIGNG